MVDAGSLAVWLAKSNVLRICYIVESQAAQHKWLGLGMSHAIIGSDRRLLNVETSDYQIEPDRTSSASEKARCGAWRLRITVIGWISEVRFNPTEEALLPFRKQPTAVARQHCVPRGERLRARSFAARFLNAFLANLELKLRRAAQRLVSCIIPHSKVVSKEDAVRGPASIATDGK